MTEALVRARRTERVEELCAAAIRAIAGERDLHFRGQRLHRGREPLPLFAPHLHPSIDADDFDSFRGAADGLALRLIRSDAELHRSLSPPGPVERLVFDLLEQYRVESLVPATMPGIAHNLRHRFVAWSLAFHRSGLTDSDRGILLYTVAQTCRARVLNERVVEETEDLLEATRGALAPLIGDHLPGLRRDRFDQTSYARHALAIARRVAAMIAFDDAPAADARSDADRERAAFGLVMDVDLPTGERFATATSGRSRTLADATDGYRIFTKAYDRELDAARSIRPEVLKGYRERLDARIAAQAVNIGRLARELRALLGVLERDGWDSGLEEGLIDGRRIATLVASPTERRLFRSERVEPLADGLVTFLVDCSGSMKEHAESVAVVVDVFARALELAGVACEILGFTTSSWNGGRARRDWVRAGRPAHPGRLNETCNIVFKDADASWRRARPAVAALLKEDLFREGIDGEAVDWACARMRAHAEGRRILLVFSDGSPMDGATALANDDPHYLDHHLRDVVLRQEQVGDIEIYGVGVGLDLHPYYRHSHVLDLAAAIGNQAFVEIMRMIARRRGPR